MIYTFHNVRLKKTNFQKILNKFTSSKSSGTCFLARDLLLGEGIPRFLVAQVFQIGESSLERGMSRPTKRRSKSLSKFSLLSKPISFRRCWCPSLKETFSLHFWCPLLAKCCSTFLLQELSIYLKQIISE